MTKTDDTVILIKDYTNVLINDIIVVEESE